MAAWLRVLANPRVLKRFAGTKAGRRAMFKYGKMLVNSKMAQDAVKKIFSSNRGAKSSDKQMAGYQKQFNELQARIAALESQLQARDQDNAQLEAMTFTLGRQVVQLRQLYAQMQADLAQSRTSQMAMATAQRTR